MTLDELNQLSGSNQQAATLDTKKTYTLEELNNATGQKQISITNKPTENVGFVHGLIQGIASPFLRTVATVGGIVKATEGLAQMGIGKVIGNEKFAQEGLTSAEKAVSGEAQDYGYFGKVSPWGYDAQGKELKGIDYAADVIGGGAELASWAIGGGGLTSTAESIVQRSAGQAIKRAAITGAEIGAVGGFGTSLQQQAKEHEVSAGKTLEDTLISTAMGAATGITLGTLAESGRLLKEGAKGAAARVVNSLVKPLSKDFAYGKNPGRAVAEEHITANSLDELTTKIRDARQTVGDRIGEISSQLSQPAEDTGIRYTIPDLRTSLEPLNKAMEEAAKTNNPALLTRLENTKQAITHNLVQTDSEAGQKVLSELQAKAQEASNKGNDTVAQDILDTIRTAKATKIISTGERNLTNATYQDAFNFIQGSSDLTAWTGNASDDKIVNKALKQVYGSVREEMNSLAEKADPVVAKELTKLNEKYGDLKSAEIATKYREALVQRKDLVSLGVKASGLAGTILAFVASGGATLPTLLTGLTSVVVDKIFESPAAKTRLASLLAKMYEKEGSTALEALLEKIPALRNQVDEVLAKEKLTKVSEKKFGVEKPFKISKGGQDIELSKIPQSITVGELKDAIKARGWNIPDKSISGMSMKDTSGFVNTKVLAGAGGLILASQLIPVLWHSWNEAQQNSVVENVKQAITQSKNYDDLVPVLQYLDKMPESQQKQDILNVYEQKIKEF